MKFTKFSPGDDTVPVLTAAMRLQQVQLPQPPKLLIFCPQARLLRHAVKKWRGRRLNWFFGEIYLLGKTQNQVAVAGQFGVGAPVIGVLLEEFVAWGVEQFIWLGIAGGLQPSLHCGDLALVDTAVRDEGTSSHYLPAAPTISAASSLTNRLATAVRTTKLTLYKGTSWTTDAPYRETAAAVAHYQQLGVLTVEMETAALFAVAHCCGVEASALLAVSDSVADGVWQPASVPQRPEQYLQQVLDAIVSQIQ